MHEFLRSIGCVPGDTRCMYVKQYYVRDWKWSRPKLRLIDTLT